MSPSNRLASEQSPYLLQHAHNPVDWFPWGEEAFAKAKKENKPIFLSIGYSTCHWCHVMEHESFENESTARYLNEHFVSIKVDREERPDVDRIYMSFVQATTGSGGWPMSVWLTPELKPFVGGTYFSPKDNYGKAGFPTVLARIVETWQTNPEAVVAQSQQMTAAIQGNHGLTSSVELTMEPIRQLYNYAVSMFDKDWAGFGDAPKFPRPSILNILVRISAGKHFSNIEQATALRMIRETLRAMARGGMHDHLGGGFHRYSVDRFWHVPHFEKMLYDQAQLAIAYLENWQRSSGGEKTSKETAISILEYVTRDLLSPLDGFYSAEDADSFPGRDSTNKIEGAFYVWKYCEIQELLGEDGDLFCQFYDVAAAGNAPEGSDPHGEFTGENIFYQKLGLTGIAKSTGLAKADIEKKLVRARQLLLTKRSERPRPHRDEKILIAWNGLMISAFARCGAAFGEGKYIEKAANAAKFLLAEVITSDGKLARSFCKTSSGIAAFTDDYAFLIQGLLDLYEATFNSEWLTQAVKLQTEQDTLFYDSENGGYFSTRKEATDIIARLKDDYDGAEPSANAISANNLLRLATIMGDESKRNQAILTLQSLSQVIQRIPQAVPQVLVALERSLTPPRQLVLAGDPKSKEFAALNREVSRRFLPNLSIILATDCCQPMPAIDGKATAYLCENFVCQLPVTNPVDLARMLDA